MSDWRVLLLLGAVLSVPWQSTSAQQGSQLWQVELIVFRNLGSGSSEQTVAARPAGTTSWQPLPLLTDGASSEDADDSPPLPWTRFALLEAGQLQMTDAYRRLARSGDYEPVLHLGWRQPVSGQRAALAQNIPPLSAHPGPSGEVTLYRRQSLHLSVDLRLPAAAVVPPLADDQPAADQADAVAEDIAGEYRLRALRIIRSGETAYFDHPRFGVLARVFRAPAEDSEDNTSRR